jgi:methylthioribose-1-phosphate isomerase
VNLTWALARCRDALRGLDDDRSTSAAIALAQQIADEDVASCRAIGEHGVGLLAAIHERTQRPVNVLTHCNAGMLACVEWGTATAPVYVAHERGIPVHVWVSETRPRNQGALTAWELSRAGVPNTFVVDNTAGHLLAGGEVDLVITGADRVAANGDSANKIGTVLKALAARHHGIPFHVAIPSSTYDEACPTGAGIEIEERAADEVLVVNDRPVTAAGTNARNWAFDVTPAALITSWITDCGVLGADDLGQLASAGAAASGGASVVDARA